MNAGHAIAGTLNRQGAAELDMLAAPVAAALPIALRGSLRCRFLAPDALPHPLLAQWEVLADQAAEPNAFAEHWFLMPSLSLLAVRHDVRIAVIEQPDGMLAGIMPLAVKPAYGRIPIRNVQNWLHHNAFLGVPLIRKGLEAPFWAALLEALNDRDWATNLLHISGLTEDGAALAGLRAAAPRCDIVHRIERAALCSRLDHETYWATTVRKKKRKDLIRLANRLGELGAVRYATLQPNDDPAPWIAAFLTLEQKGWKGANGSALTCDPDVEAFFTAVCEGAHRARKLDFHRLDLGGKPIAMLINFLAAPGAFSFKIAFDEDYARYTPGVLIERYNLRILEQADIDWVDSCASPNHPMINGLWTARRSIVRVSVPLDGLRNHAVFQASRLAENGAAALKRMRGKHLGERR